MFAVTGALCLWMGVRVYQALTAEPGPYVDYAGQLEELIERFQPAAASAAPANGYQLLEEAGRRFRTVEVQFRRAMADSTGKAPPLDFTLFTHYELAERNYGEEFAGLVERTRRALDRCRADGVMDLLEQAAAAPRMMRVGRQEGPIAGWLVPELADFRQMARMNVARMALAMPAGDGAEFVAAFEGNLAIARAAGSQGFVIGSLVAQSMMEWTLSEVAASLVERRWDEETLRACAAALERQRSLTPGLELALQGERLTLLDFVQWTHTDDGRGNGRVILSAYRPIAAFYASDPLGDAPSWLGELLEYRIANVAGIGFASRRATEQKINEYVDSLVRTVRTPRQERTSLEFDPRRFVSELPRRHMVLKALLSNTAPGGSGVYGEDHLEQRVRATRVLLGLEMYRVRNGGYPETLGELVPEWAASMPVDPWTGGCFGYRVLEEGADPHGRGFLLYSFGVDGVDDGGVMDAKQPHRALSTGQPLRGVDFVFNVGRDRADVGEE